MHLNELSERSPVRIFEQSIHGGLGVGNIGVVVARHGVGKTAFLVGVALDDLFRGRKVLHVAIGKTIEHVREFYDEVFMDLALGAKLEDIPHVRRDMESHRHIKSYLGRSFTLEHLKEHVKMLRDVLDFAPAALIVDGYDFDAATREDLEALREFARDLKCELWMSATTHRESKRDAQGVPEPVAHVKDSIAVIVQMAHDGKTVQLRLLKDHENPAVSEVGLALDPTTMLLVKG
jgi:KaiC/GvpD/RAD55 family RecA-like ATPase